MRVAALYYELAADAGENRDRLLAALGAVLPDADLVVAPEAATTGVDGPAAAAAEPLDGPTVSAVRRLVDRSGGTVVLGLPERRGDRVFNAAVVVDPGAPPQVYHQPSYGHTYAWTTAFGDAPGRCFDAAAGRVGVAVCWDLDRPALARRLAAADPDVVAVPANWARVPEQDRSLVDRWAARARTLGRPVAVANVHRPAGESGFAFDGPAAVVGADGAAAVSRTPGEPAVGTV